MLKGGRPITLDKITTEVVVWAIEDGKAREQRRLMGSCKNSMHDGRTRQGVLSADEQRLAGSMNGWLFSADLKLGTVAWSGDLGKRAGPFASHDISPDGEWIASSDFGARVTIHRFSEPDKIVAYLGDESGAYATAIAFGRDGRRLYAGDESGRIRVWDTTTWQEVPALGWLAHRGSVTALAVSHDRTLIATSGDDSLKLFPIAPEPGESRRRERLSFQLGQAANWIRFARDENGADRALLHCSPDGRLNVWQTDLDQDSIDPVPTDPGSLPFPLIDHQAILLPDGKVLVVGGRSTARVALSTCHLYDPATNTWCQTGSLHRPRRKPLLTLLPDGKVLVAGGVAREGVHLVSCELYDAELGRWSPTGNMDSTHAGASWALLDDGGVLVTGGNASTASERYHPNTDSWHPAGSPGAGDLSGPAIRLPNGDILIAGGSEHHPNCQLFDPVLGEWKATGPFPKIRAWHTATLLPDGKVLLVGGRDENGGPTHRVEVYGP